MRKNLRQTTDFCCDSPSPTAHIFQFGLPLAGKAGSLTRDSSAIILKLGNMVCDNTELKRRCGVQRSGFEAVAAAMEAEAAADDSTENSCDYSSPGSSSANKKKHDASRFTVPKTITINLEYVKAEELVTVMNCFFAKSVARTPFPNSIYNSIGIFLLNVAVRFFSLGTSIPAATEKPLGNGFDSFHAGAQTKRHNSCSCDNRNGYHPFLKAALLCLVLLVVGVMLLSAFFIGYNLLRSAFFFGYEAGAAPRWDEARQVISALMRESKYSDVYQRVEKRMKELERDRMIEFVDKLLGPNNW
jgi:hypothetical protein